MLFDIKQFKADYINPLLTKQIWNKRQEQNTLSITIHTPLFLVQVITILV